MNFDDHRRVHVIHGRRPLEDFAEHIALSLQFLGLPLTHLQLPRSTTPASHCSPPELVTDRSWV